MTVMEGLALLAVLALAFVAATAGIVLYAVVQALSGLERTAVAPIGADTSSTSSNELQPAPQVPPLDVGDRSTSAFSETRDASWIRGCAGCRAVRRFFQRKRHAA